MRALRVQIKGPRQRYLPRVCPYCHVRHKTEIITALNKMENGMTFEEFRKRLKIYVVFSLSVSGQMR